MFLIGLGTAVPARRYTQRECYEALRASALFEALQPRSQTLLRKVLLGANGIEGRYLALSELPEGFERDPDTLHERFSLHAPELATRAAERALADSNSRAEQIDAVLVSTCTGYLCPGLTSYVAERLSLPGDILPLDLVGQGCGAALPNWRTAEALISSGRANRLLSVCVEVCSAAAYFDDDPGVLVSACLFGDGAGAAVWSASPEGHSRRIRWEHAESLLRPEKRDLLRFEQRNGMLRNVLTVEVPGLAAEAHEIVLNQVVRRTGVKREEVGRWILHAGGRDVLNALALRLSLTDEDLAASAAVLREYGNLSSASLYFALERALSDAAVPGWWWLGSFGAGFSSHGALLRVE